MLGVKWLLLSWKSYHHDRISFLVLRKKYVVAQEFDGTYFLHWQSYTDKIFSVKKKNSHRDSWFLSWSLESL